MKTATIVLSFFLLPFIAIAQSSTLYSKSQTFKGAKISVKQNEQRFPRTYTLEIEKNNTVITKTDTLYDGYINEAWITDLDSDDNPEIIVSIGSPGSGSYGSLKFFEFSNYSLNAYSLPGIPSNLKNRYAGHDNFDVKDENIIKSFPLYNDSDPNCCPSGGRAVIKYTFRGNSLSEIGYQINDEKNSTHKAAQSLSITIVSAKGLPKMDAFSQTDAWIKVLVGDREVGRTKKVQDSSNPYFNEELVLDRYNNQKIAFQVYDKDATHDNLVGEATIIKPKSGTYPIMHRQSNGNISNNGMLTIKVNK